MRARFGIAIAFGISLSTPFAAAGAGSLWDGLWDLNAAKSHWTDHSFSLARQASGLWRYSDGSSAYEFALDGKPYPESNAPEFTIAATPSGGNVLEMHVACYGRDVERDRWTLSTDGKALTGAFTRIFPDGREAQSTALAVRVTGVSGFDGTWKQLADNSTASGSAPASNQPRRPYWVISTSSDGVMTWFIPATGELIRGKADGQSRPLVGPQQPARRTFVWKQISPYRIDFFADDNGHLVEYAVEELSPDGKSFTDTLWSPGHENEKDVRLFEKR